jgi:hypothetical protein
MVFLAGSMAWDTGIPSINIVGLEIPVTGRFVED